MDTIAIGLAFQQIVRTAKQHIIRQMNDWDEQKKLVEAIFKKYAPSTMGGEIAMTREQFRTEFPKFMYQLQTRTKQRGGLFGHTMESFVAANEEQRSASMRRSSGSRKHLHRDDQPRSKEERDELKESRIVRSRSHRTHAMISLSRFRGRSHVVRAEVRHRA